MLWTLCYEFKKTEAGRLAAIALRNMGRSQNLMTLELDTHTVELPHCPHLVTVDIINIMAERNAEKHKSPLHKITTRLERPWTAIPADIWFCRPSAFAPE